MTARSGPAVGGMIVDDDTPCVSHPNPLPRCEAVKNVDRTDGQRCRHSSGLDLDRPSTAYLRKRKRARSPGARSSGPREPADSAAWVDAEFDTAMVCAPKRLRRIAVRNASLPTAAVALRSRRAERLGRRKREKALRRAAGRVEGCKLTVEAVRNRRAVLRSRGWQATGSGRTLTRSTNSPRFETCIVGLK
jgi:hypothetical protein